MSDKMIIECDVAIPTDDSLLLRADISKRVNEESVPVIMTMGPCGKGVCYSDGYASQWKWLMEAYPNLSPSSSKEFMTWETLDPEVWVPWGYVCIRVDSRGAGRSPDHLETKDYYDAIE